MIILLKVAPEKFWIKQMFSQSSKSLYRMFSSLYMVLKRIFVTRQVLIGHGFEAPDPM